MTKAKPPTPILGRRVATVAVEPGEVDAGAEVAVTVRVTTSDDDDLAGQPVVIRTAGGREIASAVLGDDDAASTPDTDAYRAEVRSVAPPIAGHQTWVATLPAADVGGTRYEATAVVFSFVVTAHAARINVWDLPAAIAAGERFPLKVGIKCTCGCDLSGRLFEVRDQAGSPVASGWLGQTPWPGRESLYYATAEAPAPTAPGFYEWSVTTPEWDGGTPHAAGTAPFALRVVETPDSEVTVEAFDRDTQAPIRGIHVLLHPYRALTDEHGVARIRVARGRYRLVVSGLRYVPYETTVDARERVTERAELSLEPKTDGYFQQ